MAALGGFITYIAVPLLILNVFGGLVAGIWLAILGEWRTIGAGVLIYLVSVRVLRTSLMPSILLAAPARLCEIKGKPLGAMCFATISNVYVTCIITLWCCGILLVFVRDATTMSLIPKLLWSYGLATGPWTYLAGEDARRGGTPGAGLASMLAAFLAQLAYVTIMVLGVFTTMTYLRAIKIFGGFMAAALVIQIILAILILREVKAAQQNSRPY
jgi:hypothetical protein